MTGTTSPPTLWILVPLVQLNEYHVLESSKRGGHKRDSGTKSPQLSPATRFFDRGILSGRKVTKEEIQKPLDVFLYFQHGLQQHLDIPQAPFASATGAPAPNPCQCGRDTFLPSPTAFCPLGASKINACHHLFLAPHSCLGERCCLPKIRLPISSYSRRLTRAPHNLRVFSVTCII